MNENCFGNSVLAIIIGTGAGYMLSAIGQQVINNYHVKHCPAKPGHQLVYMQGFLGDTFYCLDKRTL
jgi:hypothetical protein